MSREADQRKSRGVAADPMVDQHRGGGSRAFRVPDGMKTFRITKEGSYPLDFIPFIASGKNPHVAKGNYAVETTYFAHRNIGVNEDTLVCPAKTFSKPCPICEYRLKLKNEDEKKNEKMLAALKPTERQLWLVIDTKNPDDGVQLFDYAEFLFGKHLRKKLRNCEEAEQERRRYFADPVKGLTVVVGASEEKGQGRTWYTCTDIEFRARKKQYATDEDESDAFIVKQPCLDDLRIELPYEKLKQIFEQRSDDDPVDDDDLPKKPAADEDTPAHKPKAKAPPVDDDEMPKPKAKPPVDDDEMPKPKAKAPPPEEEPETPKPKPKPAPAAEEDQPKVNIKLGGYARHPAHGIGEIVKIQDGYVKLETEEGGVTSWIDEAELLPLKPKKAAPPPEEPPPPPKKAPPADDDAPPVKKKPAPPVDDDDAPPVKKKAPPVDDDDAPPVKKKAPPVDDDDAPPVKKKPAPPQDD